MSTTTALIKTPSEAAETTNTSDSFWAKVTVTCNMSTPGYPALMIAALDSNGVFHPNLSVTEAQFASAQFAQQNKYNVLFATQGSDPCTVIDMQVYS